MFGIVMAGGSFEKLTAGRRPSAAQLPRVAWLAFVFLANLILLRRTGPGNKRRNPRPPDGGGVCRYDSRRVVWRRFEHNPRVEMK